MTDTMTSQTLTHVCTPPKVHWWQRLGREWVCPERDSLWTLTLFSKGLLVQEYSRRWVVTDWQHVNDCPLHCKPGEWLTAETVTIGKCRCPDSITKRVSPDPSSTQEGRPGHV